MPEADSEFSSRLAWTTDSLHLDFVASIAREQHPNEAELTLWIGLDDMGTDGEWVTSAGASYPANGVLWRAGEPGDDNCAVLTATSGGSSGGYVGTSRCLDKNYFVCAAAPRTAEPDNPCPGEYMPHKGECYLPKLDRLSYDDATVTDNSRTLND